DGDARGLDLERGSRRTVDDALELGLDTAVQRAGLAVELVHEADVELRTVTAHQVNLGGQARQRREIAQRTAGDDGRGGLVQSREGPQRADRLGERTRL